MARNDETLVHELDEPTSELPVQREAHPALLLLSGADAGRSYRLAQGHNVVGRSEECDIVIEDDGVSRRHCDVEVDGDVVYARDEGSTNGTRRNGDLLEGRTSLEEGDILLFGKTVVARFTMQDPVVENLHRRLFDAAVHDGLTGVYNKRYLIERFDQEFAFAARHARPLTVLIYDIDHFKKINDSRGHAMGDQVLREIASFVGRGIRKEDLHARWGGEEFVVLMRETDMEQARVLAERLLEGIRKLRFKHQGEAFGATVSVGISSTSAGAFDSPMELFIRADKMLYEAKESGRDRVVVDARA